MSSRGPPAPPELSEELIDAAESSPPEDEPASSGPVELAGPVSEPGFVDPEKPDELASDPPHANAGTRTAEMSFRNTPSRLAELRPTRKFAR